MAVVCLFSLLLAACGARSLNKRTARDLIAGLDGGALAKEGIYIDSVSQTGPRDAVAEGTVHAAFRFEKVDEKWVVREVRLGNHPWEKIENILRALDRVKTEETRTILERVALALEKYAADNGALPSFTDYVSLSDALAPKYLNPLVRQDAWQRPLAAYQASSGAVRLISAGPDGQMGTGDDIELIKPAR